MFCKYCGKENKSDAKFCSKCGQKIRVKPRFKFFEWIKNRRKGIFIFIGIILFFVVIGIYSDYSENQDTSNYSSTVSTTSAPSYNQNEITASVVNIFCPSTEEDEDVSGGSGTIITEDGLVLTNSHIIPQDEKYLHVEEDGCLVVLPDPTTGQPDTIYLAHPIVLPDISDKYDLAFMDIYAAYYDGDTKEYVGDYPRKFPTFDDTTRCNNENVKLGEPVRIFGYPAISGGYSLTITDGVVSSFPGDGLIVTSAKISHGNSGGLAVDKDGCMVGVPSMVSSDESESLGIIYSMDLVWKFEDEVVEYMKNNKK